MMILDYNVLPPRTPASYCEAETLSLGGIMTVRFSCRCPNADYLGFEATPEAIIASAAKAEELGFDAVFVNDHIIVDSSTRSASWTNTFDPLIALSFIAANTTRIGLGVSVLNRAVPQSDRHR
jgi:hypothetical protein